MTMIRLTGSSLGTHPRNCRRFKWAAFTSRVGPNPFLSSVLLDGDCECACMTQRTTRVPNALSANPAFGDHGDWFRSLLEAAPDAMIIVGAAGIIRLVNKQAESLFGFGRDEMIGREIEMLIP